MKQNPNNSPFLARRPGRFLESAAAAGFVALIGLSILSLGWGAKRSWAAVFLDQGSARGGWRKFASAPNDAGPYDGLGGNALLGRATQVHGCLNGMDITVESEVIDKTLREILEESGNQFGAPRMGEDGANYWPEALSGYSHIEGEGWAVIARREPSAVDPAEMTESALLENLFAEDGTASPALALALARRRLDAIRTGTATFQDGRPVVELIAANDPQGSAPCRVMRYRPKSAGWRSLGAPATASPEWAEIQGWMSPMKVLLGWEMADQERGIPNGLAACLVENGPDTAPNAREVVARLQADGFRAKLHSPQRGASSSALIDAEDPQGRRVMAFRNETPGKPPSWILTLTQEEQ